MRKTFLFALFCSLLALDFYTKYWTMHNLPFGSGYGSYPYGGLEVVQGFWGIDAALVYVINYGAAWSLFSEYTVSLLYIRIGLLTLLLLYFLLKKPGFFRSIFLVFIMAGASGNLIDGFLYGGVVDMIKVVLWGYHYPIFNLADSYIVAGGALIILSEMLKKKKKALKPSS